MKTTTCQICGITEKDGAYIYCAVNNKGKSRHICAGCFAKELETRPPGIVSPKLIEYYKEKALERL